MRLKIGYLALSKASWLTPKIEGLARATFDSLKSIPDAEIVFDGITATEEEAASRAKRFAREGVDAVVMHFVTFPVGATIPAAASELDVPFLLLANPEKPGPGAMWEQNSFCGANMAAHGLRRLGKAYSYTLAPAEQAAEKLAAPLAALRAHKAAREQRVGLVGGRVPGFYTSNFDELQLRRDLGTTVEVIDLLEVVETARALDDGALADGRAVVKDAAACVVNLAEEELDQGARMYAAFRKVAEKYRLDSLAVRCWPEWGDYFGVAPCAVIGMLIDHGLVTSCEGDVTGAVTMNLLRAAAGGGLPFFMDLIQYDFEANTGLVWHCGASPKGLCRRFEETRLRKHMRVDGGNKKGLANEFPLKAGRVTLAKYDTDVDGRQRMLLAPGEALDTEAFLRGNPLTVRFDACMEKMIQTIMDLGFEHHYALIHADVAPAMREFCAWKNIDLIEP